MLVTKPANLSLALKKLRTPHVMNVFIFNVDGDHPETLSDQERFSVVLLPGYLSQAR